jgi:uncharacterized LabA/DUF88 family protein
MVSVAVKFRRQMIFIDGTNFLRGLGREIGIDKFKAYNPSHEALDLAAIYINMASGAISRTELIRTYWFASYKGNEETKFNLSEKIRKLGFEPLLYQLRGDREKGVDIALTMSMLTNAFNQNFDIGLLIAGDEDYLELVNEVKRYGPIMCGSYFSEGLSPRLKLAFDHFQHISHPAKDDRYLSLVQAILKEYEIA